MKIDWLCNFYVFLLNVLNFVPDKIVLIPQKCYKRSVLLHYCIPDAIDRQQGSESRGALNCWVVVIGLNKWNRLLLLLPHVICYEFLRSHFEHLSMAYQSCFSARVCFQTNSTQMELDWVTDLLFYAIFVSWLIFIILYVILMRLY